MKICVFGASVTQGYHDDQEGGWVNRLAKEQLRIGETTVILNCGVSGDNSDDICKRFETEARARRCDVALFSFGNNDSMCYMEEKRNAVPMKKFEKNLVQLHALAKKQECKVIFITAMPVNEKHVRPIPWHDNAEYRNDMIEQYADTIKDFCQQHDLPCLDLFKEASQKKDWNELMSDGIHPTPAGHAWMAQKVKEYLTRLKYL